MILTLYAEKGLLFEIELSYKVDATGGQFGNIFQNLTSPAVSRIGFVNCAKIFVQVLLS